MGNYNSLRNEVQIKIPFVSYGRNFAESTAHNIGTLR
jgi:hypothetical protein